MFRQSLCLRHFLCSKMASRYICPFIVSSQESKLTSFDNFHCDCSTNFFSFEIQSVVQEPTMRTDRQTRVNFMHFVRRMLKKRKQPSLPSTGIKSVIAMFEEAITSLVCRYGVILCKTKENNSCHLLFNCTSYRLNMFRALLCTCLSQATRTPLQPNVQHTANQERYDQCGNQHHSRELLMMDIVMPEIC